MKRFITTVGIMALLILNVFLGVRVITLEENVNSLEKRLKSSNTSSMIVDSPVTQVSTVIESDVSAVYNKVERSVVTVINNPYGSGSGVIYKVQDNQVYIITNHHVIDNNKTVEVILNTGERIDAKVIGSDALADIALLKIESNIELTAMVIGDSSQLNVGETVLAIGSPSGEDFSGSLSVGVISGKDRIIEVDTNNDNVVDWDMVLIQTDAAINPGNSGGPLVNMAGQLVGINTLKLLDIDIEGMGFANPINEVISIVTQLEDQGEVTRPFLGISGLSVEDLIFRSRYYPIKLPDVSYGVYINEVSPNSPADKANLQAEDVIIEFDGNRIEDFKTFRRYLYQFEVGDSVEVKIVRGSETMTKTINLD